MHSDQTQFRLLPAVDDLLQSLAGQQLSATHTRALTLQAIRASLDEARASIRAGHPCPSAEELLNTARTHLEQARRPQLQPVINATGVIINTNLGRAPLSQEALEAVRQVAGGYSNLEYNLAAGERGSRHEHVNGLLRELTGAQAALVTNNNAAAVLLALSTLAAGRKVIISRGQLVEIGGGFRIPDVMRQSGCELVEVGTTNRTRLSDFASALTQDTALLLAVHPSNFQITGFIESTPLRELAELAHQHGLVVMEDQGSGCLLASEKYGLAHEPMPQESLAAGADLVCFSGDKLLGGPQAGILLGKAEIIQRIARHPLMRALRIDKMTLAALEATLRHYQRAEAATHIPIWRMIASTEHATYQRASKWAEQLRARSIVAQLQSGSSTIGGGSLPGETLPTTLLALPAAYTPLSLAEIAQRLRSRSTPIITRIYHDSLLLDPRTVLEEQDEEVVQALFEELANS
ncbi:MAG TPA: L-seryl-tRNA(Sec) selenium transferase [Ktedonobacteraceae bacterium]